MTVSDITPRDCGRGEKGETPQVLARPQLWSAAFLKSNGGNEKCCDEFSVQDQSCRPTKEVNIMGAEVVEMFALKLMVVEHIQEDEMVADIGVRFEGNQLRCSNHYLD
jgi:hypothetical protein